MFNTLLALALFLLAAVNFYFGVTGVMSSEGPELMDFINLMIGLFAITIGVKALADN